MISNDLSSVLIQKENDNLQSHCQGYLLKILTQLQRDKLQIGIRGTHFAHFEPQQS